MTINDITLNGPKVFVKSFVIFWFFRSKLFPITVRFSAEVLPPCGPLPPRGGFLEFVVPSWQFRRAICHRKYKFSVLLVFSELLLHSVFWSICLMHPIFQFFNIRNQNVSLPNSPRDQGISDQNSWKYFLHELMNSRFVSLGDWEIFHQCTEWNKWSFEGLPKYSFAWCFPVGQEILDIPKIAIAFHGIWPPFIIQSWLQQYRRCPFFNSAYCPLSNPIYFWMMRWGRPMIPW